MKTRKKKKPPKKKVAVLIEKTLQQINEEKFKLSMRKLRLSQEKYLKDIQDGCEHLQGCNPLSDAVGVNTCIVWHGFDDGVLRGVCDACGRVFEPTDPDYQFWKNKPSGNTLSASTRYLESNKEGPKRPTFQPPNINTPLPNPYEILSDEEVIKAFEGLQKTKAAPLPPGAVVNVEMPKKKWWKF